MHGSDTSSEGSSATPPEPTLTRRRLLVSAGVAATVFITPRLVGPRAARAGLRHGAERELEGIRSILGRGNGSDRQLRVFNANRDIVEVVREIADATEVATA